MAQFDHIKKPMTLAESDDLLHGRNHDAEFFGFWFGLLKGIAKLALVVAVIGAITYLCVAVPALGWAVAAGVLLYAIVEISRAGKK
jgi:hypothetical protein